MPAWVVGDPRELEQVFVNLLTNARDASPEGGTVTCRLERNGESVSVVVGDRGPGIATAAPPSIFQPFYTTKTSGGTGLGLAISREIVHRHGGEIALQTAQRRRRRGAGRAAARGRRGRLHEGPRRRRRGGHPRRSRDTADPRGLRSGRGRRPPPRRSPSSRRTPTTSSSSTSCSRTGRGSTCCATSAAAIRTRSSSS